MIESIHNRLLIGNIRNNHGFKDVYEILVQHKIDLMDRSAITKNA
jgi:hypothetical protein